MVVLSSETVDSLASKVQKRIDAINDVKFTFRTRSNNYTSSDIHERKEEYSILHSNDHAYPRNWICWKVYHPKNESEWELDRFMVFDGKNLWSYDRVDPHNPGTVYKWSRGIVQPCVDPAPQIEDQNRFPRFLFMGIVGYGTSFVDEYVKSLGPDKWRIIGNPSTEEYVLERDIKAKNWDEKDKYSIKAFLSLHIAPKVWRTESISPGFPKVDFDEVESFAESNDLYYPLKGRSVSYATAKRPYDMIYEFEVESVERLTDGARSGWIPEWPTGTLVLDQVQKKNITIPHTRKQMQERQDSYFASLGVDREIKSQWKRRWIILSVNLIGLLAIAYLLIRKIKKQRCAK